MFDLLATSECAHVAVPAATEQAMRYYTSGNVLWILAQSWSLIVPLLFLIKGFTGKLSHFAEKWGKNWFFSIVVYLLLFVFLYQLLYLPLDFYGDYLREHAYGLSTQTLGRWGGNYAKTTLIVMITASLSVWIFYLLLKKSPRRWWLYCSLVSIALTFAAMLVQPIWVDPLFNEFGPMKNKQLEGQILDLAARAGIEHGRIFEVDMSKDTNRVNAYVIGLGSTNRIVLWDTLIQKMTPEQILFVMGHEMGHYILHHIWWSLIYYSLLSFLIFYLTYKSAHYLLFRYQKQLGFDRLSNIASLPLLLFLITFFQLLATPLNNFVSRYMEHQADQFGIEITQNNRAAGEGFLVLQQENLANPRPGPIFKFWRSTHPPLGERIDFFNSYCPWNEGQPLKYGKYFKSEKTHEN